MSSIHLDSEWTPEEQEQHQLELADAFLSGRFKQTCGDYRIGITDPHHCAVGVAFEVMAYQLGLPTNDDDVVFTYRAFRNYYGFDQATLIDLNELDHETVHKTFYEIGDMLKNGLVR